jgi:hypothetical protein
LFFKPVVINKLHSEWTIDLTPKVCVCMGSGKCLEIYNLAKTSFLSVHANY